MRPTPYPALFLLLFALTALTSGAGCAHVAPSERARMAKPKMQTMPNPQAAGFEQHVFEYREGSAGGYGTMGGGCGCN